MVKTEVHVFKGRINIKVMNEKTDKFELDPDEALEFGIMLLKAAYSAKNR